MALLRAQTVLAATDMTPSPSHLIVQNGMQLVNRGAVTWAKKSAWLRTPPFTAVTPHLGQANQRISFGEAASRARGGRGLDPETGLPPAAARVAESLRGTQAPGRLLRPFPSEARRSFHTLEELRAIVRARAGAARVAGGSVGRLPGGM